MKIDNFFTELKRRKVFKVGAAYLVVAWLAVQAASIGFPAFGAPAWALRIFILRWKNRCASFGRLIPATISPNPGRSITRCLRDERTRRARLWPRSVWRGTGSPPTGARKVGQVDAGRLAKRISNANSIQRTANEMNFFAELKRHLRQNQSM